jgi:enamine deaminase RidA (YjgF/YER057c/UK114 family)
MFQVFHLLNLKTGKLLEHASIERQTEVVLEQMKLCLDTAGSSLEHVFEMQCLLRFCREIRRGKRGLYALFPKCTAGAHIYMRRCMGGTI